MKIVSIHQPHYLPWPGYFHRIAVSDLHVVLDHVQFEKDSFINRNRLRTPQGWCWVTVPVRTKGKFGDLEINTLKIAEKHNWQRDHWKTIKFNYANAQYIDEHKTFFEDIYKQEWGYLAPLIRETMNYLLDELRIDTPLMHSSEMDVEGTKDDLVLDICKKTNAEVYLSGEMGMDYIPETKFKNNNIRVAYQDYTPPTYGQVFDGFEGKMSTVDLLLNKGPDSFDILMENNRGPKEILRGGIDSSRSSA